MFTESLLDHFTAKLKDSIQNPNTVNPVGIVTNFYCTAFGVPHTDSVRGMFTKLITMYGLIPTFEAVIALYNMEFHNKAFVMKTLATLARKGKNKKTTNVILLNDLANTIELRRQEISREPPVIPNPFEGDSSE